MINTRICILLTILWTAPCAPFKDVDREWENFQVRFNRRYDTLEELEYRKKIFIENFKEIEAHNAEYESGLHSFAMGVNQFTDQTYDDTEVYFNSLEADEEEIRNQALSNKILQIKESEVPESFDWRQHGAVTSVKDQGHCQCGWAFSAIGSIEGQLFRATNKTESLSPQALLDCSKQSRRCDKGSVSTVLHELRNSIDGITSEEVYPYKAHPNNRCKLGNRKIVAKVTGLLYLPRDDEYALKKSVAFFGPISVTIQTTRKFQKYQHGIHHDHKCSNSNHQGNHSVVVVGYGSEQGQDYWIVKNSWGVLWGEKGYIRMSRNRNNNCLIARSALIPFVKPVDS